MTKTMRSLILLVHVALVIGQDPKTNADRDTDSQFPWEDRNFDRTDQDNVARPTSSKQTFYMDKSTDCSIGDKIINANDEAVVKGRSSVTTGRGVLTCTLTIEINTALEQRKFHIKETSVSIRDCNVKLTVYDGKLGQNILDSYTCPELSGTVGKRKSLYTSGNIVTFVLERNSYEQTNYDIDFLLTPIRDGGTDCYTGDCRPGERYTTHWKFEQKYIVLIIGLAYVLLTLIVFITIVVVIIKHFCSKSSKSGGRWEQRSFGYNNPALNQSGASTASGKQVSGGGNVWVTPRPYGKEQLPKSQPPMITKRVPVVTKRFVTNDDNDSVFESDAELMTESRQNRDRNLPRTSTHRDEVRQQPRKHHEDDEVRYRDNGTNDVRLSNIEKEIAVPDKRRKHKRRKHDSSSDESYTESDYSSEEESDTETQHTDVGEEDRLDEKKSKQKKRRDHSEDEKEETNNDRGSNKHKGGKIPKEKNEENNKRRGRQDEDDGSSEEENAPPSYDESLHYRNYNDGQKPVDPTSYPPHPRENRPPQSYQDSRGAPRQQIAPYRSSPDSNRRPHPYNQQAPMGNQIYYPTNSSPYSYRSNPQDRRDYHPGSNYPGQNEPRFVDRNRLPDTSQERVSEPQHSGVPSYSYLVRRGYTNGRSPESSAAGSHNSRDHRLDESTDYSANIDSGVELMRRTTEV